MTVENASLTRSLGRANGPEVPCDACFALAPARRVQTTKYEAGLTTVLLCEICFRGHFWPSTGHPKPDMRKASALAATRARLQADGTAPSTRTTWRDQLTALKARTEAARYRQVTR